jgi:HSP20 family protein
MKRQSPATKSAKASDAHRPAASFGSLCDEIDQFFEGTIGLPDPTSVGPPSPGDFTLTPPVELKEAPDRYELAMELPGLERKDSTVEFAGGVLSVAGAKRTQAEEQSGNCMISERSYGAFRRRFSLPHDVDPERIAAGYRHGVLTVTFGKDAAFESRVCAIAVS